jgi:RNA polymerase sigma-70 factor (ECF subfamily)
MDSQQVRAMVELARAGKDEGFTEILAVYGPRLFGYFYRCTGSYHDAEDLLGELMVRLVRRLAGYDDRGRFEPWLFSIAANLVRDRIRRSRSSPPAASLESEGHSGQSLAEGLASPPAPVETGLLAGEVRRELAAALDRLDERSRQMVLLRHFGQMSFKEIAEVFDCPVGTVLAKVHRALKTLRGLLEESHELEQ